MITDETERKIVERFDLLDRGDKIKFKRACGKMLSEVSAETLMLFYKITAGMLSAWEENRVFFAICIHSLEDCPAAERTDFDKAIAKYETSEQEEITASFSARIAKILDTEWEDNGFLAEKMTRIAKRLYRNGCFLNGASLMEDLLHWNDMTRNVQKRWARTLNAN